MSELAEVNLHEPLDHSFQDFWNQEGSGKAIGSAQLVAQLINVTTVSGTASHSVPVDVLSRSDTAINSKHFATGLPNPLGQSVASRVPRGSDPQCAAVGASDRHLLSFCSKGGREKRGGMGTH